MRPTARSLTLDLLSTLRGGSMPVSGLVAAGKLFGIAENGMRVAVARLLAAGQVERDERGLYRLGAQAEPVDRVVRSWRHLEDRLRRWEGGWIGAYAGASPPRGPARRRRERALRLLGFAPLAPDLHVRPDNLHAGPAELHEELVALGLGSEALVFRMDGLDPASDARARGLWDASALVAAYAQSRRELEASAAALPTLGEAEAMVESFLLGGRVIRQLVLDPLLPEPIVPAGERRALLDALRRYDRAGRGCWSAFMARHGAPAVAAPADTRLTPAGPGRNAVH